MDLVYVISTVSTLCSIGHPLVYVLRLRDNKKEYNNKLICELLEFISPIGFEGSFNSDSDQSCQGVPNHTGVIKF